MNNIIADRMQDIYLQQALMSGGLVIGGKKPLKKALVRRKQGQRCIERGVKVNKQGKRVGTVCTKYSRKVYPKGEKPKRVPKVLIVCVNEKGRIVKCNDVQKKYASDRDLHVYSRAKTRRVVKKAKATKAKTTKRRKVNPWMKFLKVEGITIADIANMSDAQKAKLKKNYAKWKKENGY